MKVRVRLVLVILVGMVAATALAAPLQPKLKLNTPKLQEDFPAMCLDADGTPWVAYVAYDGKADVLKLARQAGENLKPSGVLAGPGIIHQPAAACDGRGAIWVIWSELVAEKDAWQLKARRVVGGKIRDEVRTIESASGSAVFCDAGTDAAGRVWVTWQSFRAGLSDIYAAYYDPAADKWSAEMRVTSHKGGDWEPRIAFGKGDEAWIVFDSSEVGNFDVFLARVSLNGKTEIQQLSTSPYYEGRASVAATPDGRGLWLAWERGKRFWGQNTRGVADATGLNFGKRVEVAYHDIATGTTTPAADPTAALKTLPVASNAPKPAANPTAKQKAKAKAPAKRKKPNPSSAKVLNLPAIVVDAEGNPWLAARRYVANLWRIAVTRYDAGAETWSAPVVLSASAFGQDRRCQAARAANGRLWFAWPSDLRKSKRALTSGIYLAEVDPAAPLTSGRETKPLPPAMTPAARWGDRTPDRPRDDRHFWSADGKRYGLYWGDFHRHTDVSNCRTPDDGCIVEQFRYAFDVSKLDLLGASDHTDAGKPYDPYEWWCNQKLADVFYVPGYFNSMYVYEREQRWPWGHRNVVFSERGGPMIYIKRALYKSMPWQAELPVGAGGADISPQELWQLLRQAGRDVSVISHTGATGMGTDWDGYDRIDYAVENVVEIYQGARVSYEGTNAPQPTVGFPKGKQLAADAHGSVKTGKDFGKFNKGVYQNALRNGHKLGVFANSDHISTHTSFGGVYAESFTRKGVIEALNARRTIAATDKIFLEFTCNGHLLGSVFETEAKPAMKIAVHGTAPLKRVTIVRNEADHKVFSPGEGEKDFTTGYTDDEPVAGENRYYVRVEQADGNMAWSSPVWVTYTGP